MQNIEKIKVAIVGAGYFAGELMSWMKDSSDRYEFVGFVDRPSDPAKTLPVSGPILGDESQVNIASDLFFIPAIGNGEIRKKVCDKLIQRGAKFISFVHKSAVVSSTAKVADGSIVGPLSVVSHNAAVGKMVAVNAGCVVGHDVVIADYATVSPNCGIMGNCKIEELVFFGAGVHVAPGTIVGEKSSISAGVTLLRDVPQNSFVANPLPRVMPKMPG